MFQKINFYIQKYPAFSQFIKFGVVGTMGAVVDFGSYALITRVFGYTASIYIFGYPIIVANMISVFLAIISNFFWNKYWTFKDISTESITKQWIQFFSLSGLTYVINQFLVSFFINYTALEKIFGSLEDIASKVLAVGIVMFINFAISKFIVFNEKKGN